MCRGVGSGVLPKKILGLNGVKSCNNMKMPFHKSRDGKLDSFYNLDKGNIEKG